MPYSKLSPEAIDTKGTRISPRVLALVEIPRALRGPWGVLDRADLQAPTRVFGMLAALAAGGKQENDKFVYEFGENGSVLHRTEEFGRPDVLVVGIGPEQVSFGLKGSREKHSWSDRIGLNEIVLGIRVTDLGTGMERQLAYRITPIGFEFSSNGSSFTRYEPALSELRGFVRLSQALRQIYQRPS